MSFGANLFMAASMMLSPEAAASGAEMPIHADGTYGVSESPAGLYHEEYLGNGGCLADSEFVIDEHSDNENAAVIAGNLVVTGTDTGVELTFGYDGNRYNPGITPDGPTLVFLQVMGCEASPVGS